MGGACSAYGGEERCIQGLVGKPEGKRPLGRDRRRWEDNIKMNRQSMRWAEHVARMVERRGVYRVLVGKPKGKRPLGRLRRRWEDNIKMDLREVGRGGYGLDRAGSG